MKQILVRFFVLALIFLQIGGGPGLHPDDPMNEYVRDEEVMGYGAAVGAAVYVVSKILGMTIGDTDFSVTLRKHLPFMSAIIPPAGWLNWKEEVLDFLGMTTLGAAVGSYASGGQLAQQFQFGLSDAISHFFLATIAEAIRGDKFLSTQPPFIDLVMVKTAGSVIRDVLLPAGIPPFRGRSREVLILNSAVEITAEAVIGAVEGAALAALYTQVRERPVDLKDYMIQEIIVGASARGMKALATVIYFGPRIHVSKSEKEKIELYAKARGVDVRWALDHAQFRDFTHSVHGAASNDNVEGFAWGRHIGVPNGFDPSNDEMDQYVGVHEAYHLNQMVESPNWIYLHVRYPEFRESSFQEEHDDRIFEQFPSSLEPETAIPDIPDTLEEEVERLKNQ